MSSSFFLFTMSAMYLSLHIWSKQVNKCNFFLLHMNDWTYSIMMYRWLVRTIFELYMDFLFSFLSIVAMLILGLLPRLEQDNRKEVKNKLGEWHKQNKMKHLRVIAYNNIGLHSLK
jgi:hypothetical protein